MIVRKRRDWLAVKVDVAPDVCREEVTAFLDQLARHRVIGPVP